MMKTEHFNALAKNDNSLAIANHINWLAIVYCHLTDSSNLKRLFCYHCRYLCLVSRPLFLIVDKHTKRQV